MCLHSYVFGFLFWKQKGLTPNPIPIIYLLCGLGEEGTLSQVGVGWVKEGFPEEVASKLSPAD